MTHAVFSARTDIGSLSNIVGTTGAAGRVFGLAAFAEGDGDPRAAGVGFDLAIETEFGHAPLRVAVDPFERQIDAVGLLRVDGCPGG
jgi:hypothetical protein